ncbi:hypothetical protein QBC34DRAFT_424162 [Podospora aff. communis PSN243]|uniref:Uncharacterized protein n=1 Tax=Podospora aff. communis PSN243 TaxID=3040156 RepID=A0AAV9GVB3_9PEZI|nr:hypothetical protein QBC34DRAFT_424162 [Podospora aff. communis PSN243]
MVSSILAHGDFQVQMRRNGTSSNAVAMKHHRGEMQTADFQLSGERHLRGNGQRVWASGAETSQPASATIPKQCSHRSLQPQHFHGSPRKTTAIAASGKAYYTRSLEAPLRTSSRARLLQFALITAQRDDNDLAATSTAHLPDRAPHIIKAWHRPLPDPAKEPNRKRAARRQRWLQKIDAAPRKEEGYRPTGPTIDQRLFGISLVSSPAPMLDSSYHAKLTSLLAATRAVTACRV